MIVDLHKTIAAITMPKCFPSYSGLQYMVLADGHPDTNQCHDFDLMLDIFLRLHFRKAYTTNN